ncbi:MAG: Uncharacterised protein [Bacteroidetes bacterium MED-G17]|nr:MAG: Uncharacterised protein [Bacteroidetes bacterium MED-G17]
MQVTFYAGAKLELLTKHKILNFVAIISVAFIFACLHIEDINSARKIIRRFKAAGL